MKHVIEVPAGHTVLVTREGLNLVIESHESSDGENRVISMDNVQDLTRASAATEKVHEPGTVLVKQLCTGSPLLFAVVGPNGKITTALSNTKKLTHEPDGIHLFRFTVYETTPAELEEFLNNLRDWYALTITKTGELVNWRAKRRDKYYYLNYVALPEYDVEGLHDLDNETNDLGNYFPEGFLTDERLAEYKATVQKLFNKWRGLCPE